MPTFRAIVDQNGGLTLPAELRKRLGVSAGTPVEFFLTVDGQVHFHAITGTTESLWGGRVQVRSPPVSIREMDDGIVEAVTERFRRASRASRVKRRKASPDAAE